MIFNKECLDNETEQKSSSDCSDKHKGEEFNQRDHTVHLNKTKIFCWENNQPSKKLENPNINDKVSAVLLQIPF